MGEFLEGMSLEYVVVINTFRRPISLVEKALRSVIVQKTPPQKVILIDQNASPLELPPDLIKNPLLQISRTTQSSVSGARNSLDLPHWKGWICFCDDDGHLAPDYSEVLEEVLKDQRLEVIAGSVIREDTHEFYSLRHKVGGDLGKFSNCKLLMGSNFCVRAEVFQDLQKFDSRFGAGAYWGSSEETDFAWKCFFSGKKMKFVSQLKVVHVPPFNESLQAGFRKSFRYARGKGALVAKWLIEEKKPLVLLEALEMSVIPLVQLVRALVTLKIALGVNNLGVLYGRWLGFFSFFQHKLSRTEMNS